jgi:hypothetical protein
MNDGRRLVCAGCGADNRAGRRFCAQCGFALPLRAGLRVRERPRNVRGGCGVSLASAPAQPAARESADAERRPVTVLFADLCGYTRLSQTIDPEDMHALLERFFGVVDAIVERFGGRVDKHIGDAVMAIFGAPVAHGDEPARAVRAADAIQRAMPALRVSSGSAYRRWIESNTAFEEHPALSFYGIGGEGDVDARTACPYTASVLTAWFTERSPATTCTMLDALRSRALTARDRVAVEALVAEATPARRRRSSVAPANWPAGGHACLRGRRHSTVVTCAAILIGGRGSSRRCGVCDEGGLRSHGLVLDFGTAEAATPCARRRVARRAFAGVECVGRERDRRSDRARRDGADRRPASLTFSTAARGGRELYEAMDSAARQRARGDLPFNW